MNLQIVSELERREIPAQKRDTHHKGGRDVGSKYAELFAALVALAPGKALRLTHDAPAAQVVSGKLFMAKRIADRSNKFLKSMRLRMAVRQNHVYVWLEEPVVQE